MILSAKPRKQKDEIYNSRGYRNMVKEGIIGIVCGMLILFNGYLLFVSDAALWKAGNERAEYLWAGLIFVVLVCGIVGISLLSAWIGRKLSIEVPSV